jgi:hypothetical protein
MPVLRYIDSYGCVHHIVRVGVTDTPFLSYNAHAHSVAMVKL